MASLWAVSLLIMAVADVSSLLFICSVPFPYSFFATLYVLHQNRPLWSRIKCFLFYFESIKNFYDEYNTCMHIIMNKKYQRQAVYNNLYFYLFNFYLKKNNDTKYLHGVLKLCLWTVIILLWICICACFLHIYDSKCVKTKTKTNTNVACKCYYSFAI